MAPVVSTNESDVKIDVEAATPLLDEKQAPPQYPIDESAEVLVVGAPENNRCFMRRRRFCQRGHGAHGHCKKSRAARFIKIAIVMFTSVFLFHALKVALFGRTHMHHNVRGYFGGCHATPLHCELIDPSASTYSINADFLPLDTKILLKDTITSGDLHVTRNPNLEANAIELQLDLARPHGNKESQGESMVCFVKRRHGVTLGIYTRNNEGAALTARSASIALSPESAGISFVGKKFMRFRGRQTRKLWKWFDRQQAKKAAVIEA